MSCRLYASSCACTIVSADSATSGVLSYRLCSALLGGHSCRSLRIDCIHVCKFCSEQQDLRRVVDPDEQRRQRTGGAVCRTDRAYAEIPRNSRAAYSEEQRG